MRDQFCRLALAPRERGLCGRFSLDPQWQPRFSRHSTSCLWSYTGSINPAPWLARIDLEGVDLGGARPTGANLRQARLNSANLSDTNLVGPPGNADLVSANLTGASLQPARSAHPCRTVTCGRDLTLANLDAPM